MKRHLIVDNTVCSGCLSCMTTCALFHQGGINQDMARIQIDLEPFEGTHAITWCHQCDDAPCEANCPTGAIQRSDNGEWYDCDDEVCIRCQMCVSVCPYGAIRYIEAADRIIKCDLCGGEPFCSQSCFTHAIRFGLDSDSEPDKTRSRYFFAEKQQRGVKIDE